MTWITIAGRLFHLLSSMKCFHVSHYQYACSMFIYSLAIYYYLSTNIFFAVRCVCQQWTRLSIHFQSDYLYIGFTSILTFHFHSICVQCYDLNESERTEWIKIFHKNYILDFGISLQSNEIICLIVFIRIWRLIYVKRILDWMR